MRKKGSYHKNRPFRLLVAAALRFVQSYLNDIASMRGSGKTNCQTWRGHCYASKGGACGARRGELPGRRNQMLLGKEAASGTAVSARARYNRFAARFLGLEKDEKPCQITESP